MAKVMTDESNYSAIAGAIRSKLGVSTRYKPSEMAAAIGSISGVSSADNGKVVVDGQLTQQTSRSVSQNGTYDTTTNNEVVVNVSGTEQRPRCVYVFDDPNNSTRVLDIPNKIYPEAGVISQQYSYVFLFADNQTTNITIDGVAHSSSDILIGSSWNGDNVYAFVDESQGFSIALNVGDGGNHACTIIAVEGTFATKYTQTMFAVASASQTISAALDEAYVLLLFCIYNGGSTASVTFMGESVTVDRYANRYSNSIYCYATKLTNLAANDVVSVSIDANAANVIGIMGIFGGANA